MSGQERVAGAGNRATDGVVVGAVRDEHGAVVDVEHRAANLVATDDVAGGSYAGHEYGGVAVRGDQIGFLCRRTADGVGHGAVQNESRFAGLWCRRHPRQSAR